MRNRFNINPGFTRKMLLNSGVVAGGIVIFLLFFSNSVMGTEKADTENRPRVGLVLGGGGARGAAHMGVIRVLEELNVPVDLVVGTSMGAIVGGLYASGYSPDELESLVDIDWDSAFRDAPPYDELPFRRKEEIRRYAFPNKLGFSDGKFHVPSGLIQGQTQIKILKELTHFTYAINDFDDLPLPFRAVTTDITSFKPVILGSGDLATAIRASMTVPGVFAPVNIDGRLLVDGGLVNNIPADVAEKLGADILIIVDVGSPYYKRERLGSVTGITGQLSRHLVRENTEEQLQRFVSDGQPELRQTAESKRVLIIQPDLGDFSATDFKHAAEAVETGRQAALAIRKQLKELSVAANTYQSWLDKQRRKKSKPVIIEFIQINNNSRLRSSVIKKCLTIRTGEPFDVKKLEHDISDIYGMGYFERVEYSLAEQNGKTGIILDVIEKSWGPDYLSFGFNLSDDFSGNSHYNFRLNYTRTCMNGLGAEWRNEVMAGEPAGFLSEFYQPVVHPLGVFVSPRYRYYDRKIDVYRDGDEIARYRAVSHRFRFDIGSALTSLGEIRGGYIIEDGKINVAIGDPGFQSFDYVRGGLSLLFDYDTTDSQAFLSQGTRVHIDYQADMTSMGSDVSVTTMFLKWYSAMTWGRYSLSPGIEVNTTFDDDQPPVQYASFIGGFMNLSGYMEDELMGFHTAMTRLVFYRRMGESARPFYIGCSAEAGNAWINSSDISLDDLKTSGALFVGKETFLGHFYLSCGVAEGGRAVLHFSIGQRYE